MKIYSFFGYAIILAYGITCVALAPAHLGGLAAVAIGYAYFVFCWFLTGLYLADVIHLGIAHRSLDYKVWFVNSVTVLATSLALYVNPVTWVNRHRLHHKHADHAGDPNKLEADGFWRTMVLCVIPYACNDNLAKDRLLASPDFRIVSSPLFAVFAQLSSFGFAWLLVREVKFAFAIWVGFRLFALWANMIQNYWTHDRRFGYRRYDDARDNAMNIREWLPVTTTFSACFQNNHHHVPSLLRLSHDRSEYDFGFMTVKLMKRAGVVQATARGAELPAEVPLEALEF